MYGNVRAIALAHFLLSLCWHLRIPFSSLSVYLPEAALPAAGLRGTLRCDRTHCLSDVADNWLSHGRPPQVIAHRGIFGLHGGVFRPDGSLEAGEFALAKGFLTFEVDTVADVTRTMISTHEWNQTRSSKGRALWSDLEFRSLPEADRQYVRRKVKDGVLSDTLIEIGTYIPSGWQYIRHIILANDGASILIDARNEEAAWAVAELSHYPEIRRGQRRIWVQVYNFNFKNAWDFIAAVEACNPAPDWKEKVPLVPSPHQDAVHRLADVDFLDTDHQKMIAGIWAFVRSFLDADLSIIGFDIPVKGGAKYYVPEQRVVFHGDLNDTYTTPYVVARYAKEYALQTVLNYMKDHYPDIPILAPSAKYMIKADGNMYKINDHTAKLVRWDPRDPVDWLFFNAGLAQTVFECRVDWAMSDDPEAALRYLLHGRGQTAPKDYNHEPANQDNIVFD